MCQRNLRLPVALIVGGAVIFCALIVVLLWGSGRIKNRVDRRLVTNEDVFQAAQVLIARSPSVHGPNGFSSLRESTVEHWDQRRWRVSGYIDSVPRPGVKVRTLYFAVLTRDGRIWNLEDLQLQSTESGTGASPGGN